MRKMIRGKYDSVFKQDGKMLVRGKFVGAMAYACALRGGMFALKFAQQQPHETWQPLKKTV